VEELVRGAFREVLDDESFEEPSSARRVILASGKVAYEAMTVRNQRGLPVPIVRVEQLHPWPEGQVVDALARYERASEVIWLQEEPENMGAWPYVHGRLHRILREDFGLRHVSRSPAASPATGSHTVHHREQQEVLERAFEGL
jgi:2-oxoglutarate dehydrogenase E1 component